MLLSGRDFFLLKMLNLIKAKDLLFFPFLGRLKNLGYLRLNYWNE